MTNDEIPQNPDTYRCAHCGRDFPYSWSDDEAEQEAAQQWGVRHASTDPRMACVCDDCYQRFMAWFEQRA